MKDEPSGNDYSHRAESDGQTVTGSYRVLMADGRTQIVSYQAEANGYVADIKYQGDAQIAEYRPSFKAAYRAAPAPTARPSYSAADANSAPPITRSSLALAGRSESQDDSVESFDENFDTATDFPFDA